MKRTSDGDLAQRATTEPINADALLAALERRQTKRGRHAPGAQVIVKDPGPNYGRPARIEGSASPGMGPGYYIRFAGESVIRTALTVEAAS